MEFWSPVQEKLDWLALPLFLVGLGIIVWRNWQQWKRDRVIAAELRAQAALPVTLTETPLVTVLAAGWNEADNIAAFIESFRALAYPCKELLLIAGGKDKTFAIAQSYAADNISILEQLPGEGKQRALRKGWPFAKGEIIYLTDSDCLMTDVPFERTLAPLINDSAQAATGNYLPLKQQRNQPFVVAQWSVDHYNLLRSPEESSGLVGANCAIRRSAIEKAGGFASDAMSGTDYTLARQLKDAGYKIHLVKTSLVETEYSEDIPQYYYRQSRWLRNLITIGLHFKDYTSARQAIMGGVIAVVFLSAPFFIPLLGSICLALWLLLIVYGWAARLRYVFLLGEVHGSLRLRAYLWSCAGLWVDTFTWGSALIQSFVPALRTSWR